VACRCAPYHGRSAIWVGDGRSSLIKVLNAPSDIGAPSRRVTGPWFDPRGLPDPRTGAPRYDPSGLVKGWAVQQAARHLAALDGYGWCLNAGGDILLHAPADQPPWRVGIEDPDNPSRVMQVIALCSGAVAKSGTAHRGAHIIDPHTRRPATALRAITVIGPDLTWADVYATAAARARPNRHRPARRPRRVRGTAHRAVKSACHMRLACVLNSGFSTAAGKLNRTAPRSTRSDRVPLRSRPAYLDDLPGQHRLGWALCAAAGPGPAARSVGPGMAVRRRRRRPRAARRSAADARRSAVTP
jgi:hypothetical protein